MQQIQGLLSTIANNQTQIGNDFTKLSADIQTLITDYQTLGGGNQALIDSINQSLTSVQTSMQNIADAQAATGFGDHRRRHHGRRCNGFRFWFGVRLAGTCFRYRNVVAGEQDSGPGTSQEATKSEAPPGTQGPIHGR